MVLAKVLFLIAIWLSVLNNGCSESGDVSEDVLPSPVACLNCTICQYPCHTPAPPSYETPPPQPPPPPLPDFPLYGAPPPPPPPPRQPKGGCPPTPVVQCCQNPPPATNGYSPPATNGYSPPATYGYPPPATYEYVPYNNFSASSSLQIFFFPSMISTFSFAALL